MPPTILLWTHEEDHEELLSYNLIKEGFIVSTVAHEDEIIPQFQSIEPDIILMGECSSDQVFIAIVEEIKGSKQERIPPVICLTTKSAEAKDNLACGVVDVCLTLPMKPKKIISIVRKLLDKESA
jgi:DNA-binding response OmpR family regulator